MYQLQQHIAHYAEHHAPALQTMAVLARCLIGASSIDLSMLKRAILLTLREQGVITNGKPLSPAALGRWFSTTPISLAISLVAPILAERLNGDGIHGALLNRRASHPLVWMILWAAAHPNSSTTDLARGFLNPEVGLSWQDDGQGMLWIEADLRGDAQVQQIVLNALSIQDAAEKLKVSPTAVRRYLRKVQCAPASCHEQGQREMRQAHAISEITHMLKSSPAATRVDVHRRCKAAVSWNGDLLAELLVNVPEARPRQRGLFPDSY
jgi:predicted transcriptional regulator